MSDDNILSLVAAMMRAKESGNTDEEARQGEAVAEICRAAWTACEKAHVTNGGPLDTNLCLRSVAVCLGTLIKRHTDNPAAAGIVALDMTSLVLSTAMELYKKP